MKLFEIPIYYRTKTEALKDKSWRTYEYNEIVGWIVLEGHIKAIRAEYFLIRERPSKVLVRKEFEPKGKLFQVHLGSGNSGNMYGRILKALKECQESSLMAKFHINLETFEAVGPFLNWDAVCNASSMW